MSIYRYLDYKAAIKFKLAAARDQGLKLTFEKMSEASRVQKTYLSKVLNHKGDLNKDQLFSAAEYLFLKPLEIEFLFLLYEHNTSYLPKRKLQLEKQIKLIQSQQLKTESHIKSQIKSGDVDTFQKYYLDPYLQIIHMFLTIDRFRKNPKLILSNLPELNEFSLNSRLNILKELNIVREENQKLTIVNQDLHLTSDSPIYEAYRTLLRLKSLEKQNQLSKDKVYNFSVIFSSDPGTKDKIHELFLNYLKEVQKLVSKNEETEVYQLNYDLFSWS